MKKEINIEGTQQDVNLAYRICRVYIMKFVSKENFIRKYYIENNKKLYRMCLP